jgi:hypothetical protein
MAKDGHQYFVPELAEAPIVFFIYEGLASSGNVELPLPFWERGRGEGEINP